MWGTMMASQLTLGSILERAGKLFADVEIVSRISACAWHRYTYREFYRRARSLGEALQHCGLHRGERVATLMHNHHIHLETFFGVPAVGGVIHTVNHRLHPNDVAYIMSHAEDRFLIVDEDLLHVYEQIKSQVRCEKVIVAPHGSGGYRGPGEN